MTSAFATPILVRPNHPSSRLERVPLSGATSGDTYSEEWLQDLLYQHPVALPIAEIDDSFTDLVPLCREMDTSAGPIDVVYITRAGRPVIVEAKLWRNPEARRKVVGRILDYAKELSRWTYETFDAAVRRARRVEDGARPSGLAEIVGVSPGSPEEAQFFDGVSQSLRRGDLLLLIVGDGIREGVGAITDFLENHASLHFTFGFGRDGGLPAAGRRSVGTTTRPRSVADHPADRRRPPPRLDRGFRLRVAQRARPGFGSGC